MKEKYNYISTISVFYVKESIFRVTINNKQYILLFSICYIHYSDVRDKDYNNDFFFIAICDQIKVNLNTCMMLYNYALPMF